MSLSSDVKNMYEMWFLEKEVAPLMQCCIKQYGKDAVIKEVKKKGLYIFLKEYIPEKADKYRSFDVPEDIQKFVE